MPADVTSDTRFELAALTDRLVYGNETTFSRTDAIRLNELVPKNARAALFGVEASLKTSGSSFSGHAAGVGNVSVDDGEKTRSVGNAMKGTMRAGQWIFTRDGRNIVIRQVMSVSLEEGREVMLAFKRDGEPKCLKLQMPVPFKLGPVVFTIGRFADWKTPTIDA